MALSSAYLDAFLAICQTGSFTKAAEKLHVTQSALSQRILNLEKELETTLFIRDRSGLRRTPEADELLRYCQIKKELEEICLRSLKSQNTVSLAGSIRLGGFSSVLASIAMPALAPLLEAHPEVGLQLFSQEFEALFELLKKGEISWLILDDRIEREGVERILLGVEKNILVQKRKYSGPEVYLDHDPNDETTLKYLRKVKKSTKNLRRFYLDDIYGVLEGARLGIGRAVVPEHLVHDDKDLEIVNKKDILEVPVYLYHFAQPYYSPLHEAVVKALKKGFSEALS